MERNKEMNQNVKVALYFTFLSSICDGIWGTSVLSGYLQQLTDGSNTKVGLSEGLQGTVQAFIAIPAGFVSDKYGRERVLHIAVVAGMISSLSFALSLNFGRTFLSHSEEYIFSTLSLCLVGAYYGFWSAPSEAIFHNSLTPQQRPKYTTYKYSLRVLGASTGPILSLVAFKSVGDDWSLNSLRTVMQIGTALALFPTIILCLFKEKNSLGDDSEVSVSRVNTNNSNQQSNGDSTHGNGTLSTSHNNNDPSVADVNNGEPVMTNAEEIIVVTSQEQQQEEQLDSLSIAKQKVPMICALSDVLFGIASGMTIKFFPLFFKDETGLSPADVNIIFAITPFLLAVTSVVLQKMSKTSGRVQVILASKGIGIFLLFLIAFMGVGYDKKTEHPKMWTEPWIIVPIYIVRTVLMNSTAPLQKSVLMDYCTKESRGKWSSLESITQFGWSGSALVGGILADKYGYGASFFATAAMQFVGWIMLFFLLPYVPISHDMPLQNGETIAQPPTHQPTNSTALVTPLLGNQVQTVGHEEED